MPPNTSRPRNLSPIHRKGRAARLRGKPMTRSRPHRVVIVDEHPMAAEWIDRLFRSQADLEVCGLAATFEVALETIAEHEPDIVITELALNDRRGAEVVRLIKSRFAQVPLLVFSAMPETMCAEAAIQAGA